MSQLFKKYLEAAMQKGDEITDDVVDNTNIDSDNTNNNEPNTEKDFEIIRDIIDDIGEEEIYRMIESAMKEVGDNPIKIAAHVTQKIMKLYSATIQNANKELINHEIGEIIRKYVEAIFGNNNK